MAFNQLTDAEAERLALLLEECGEVIQVIGKIQRHGYDSQHRDYGNVPNRQLLEKELGDVLAAVDLLAAQTGYEPHLKPDVSPVAIESARAAKHGKVRRFLHHQGSL